jgi:hypothetical protein
MSDGFPSLAEAFAEAAAPAEPATGEAKQAPAETTETATVQQPTEGDTAQVDPLVQAMLDDSPEAASVEVGSDEFFNVKLPVRTVDGPQQPTVRELTESYMRQSDYTKKTQELAAQRKSLETAEQFRAEYEKNPSEFARQLAVEAGWIADDDPTTPRPDAIRIPSQEEIEQRIQVEVDKRIQTDPDIEAARLEAARSAVNSKFDELETKYGIDLTPKLRQELINEAADRGVADLELVTQARIARAQERMRKAAQSQQAAPNRPTSTRPEGSQTTPTDEGPKIYEGGIREAWAEAAAESQAV